jgi:hypothetical protein
MKAVKIGKKSVISVLFRLSEGKENKISTKAKHYMGMATADNMVDLFWLLDQFGDPNQFQIKKLNDGQGAVCFQAQYKDISEEMDNPKGTDFSMTPKPFNKKQPAVELDEGSSESVDEDDGWFTPNWSEYNVYG